MASRERERVLNTHTGNAYGIPSGESGWLEPWQADEMCDRLKYGKRVDEDHKGPQATADEERERTDAEKAARRSELEEKHAEATSRLEDAEAAVEALEVENAALLAQVEELTSAAPQPPKAEPPKAEPAPGRFSAQDAPKPPAPPKAEAPAE